MPEQENQPHVLPFGLRYMQMAPTSTEASRGTNATSKQTTQDGEEEADTDWNDQNDF